MTDKFASPASAAARPAADFGWTAHQDGTIKLHLVAANPIKHGWKPPRRKSGNGPKRANFPAARAMS